MSVVSGCFFHLSQNIYRKIQSAGFTNQYIENAGFALLMKMLPSLTFVPESQVIHYFNLLMEEFPTFAIEIAEYFEDTYIGRLLPNHTRIKPPFQFRLWNLYTRVNLEVARKNFCGRMAQWISIGYLLRTSQFHQIASIFTAGSISTISDVNKVGIWGGNDSLKNDRI